jgi:hypothetical protein
MPSAILAEIMSYTPGAEISPGCFKRLASAPAAEGVVLTAAAIPT